MKYKDEKEEPELTHLEVFIREVSKDILTMMGIPRRIVNTNRNTLDNKKGP